jgi:hypothetical protein
MGCRASRMQPDFHHGLLSATASRPPIPLTHRELEILSYLAEHRDRMARRQEVVRAVWGYLDTDLSTRMVDVTIARLRRERPRSIIIIRNSAAPPMATATAGPASRKSALTAIDRGEPADSPLKD